MILGGKKEEDETRLMCALNDTGNLFYNIK